MADASARQKGGRSARLGRARKESKTASGSGRSGRSGAERGGGSARPARERRAASRKRSLPSRSSKRPPLLFRESAAPPHPSGPDSSRQRAARALAQLARGTDCALACTDRPAGRGAPSRRHPPCPLPLPPAPPAPTPALVQAAGPPPSVMPSVRRGNARYWGAERGVGRDDERKGEQRHEQVARPPAWRCVVTLVDRLRTCTRRQRSGA